MCWVTRETMTDVQGQEAHLLMEKEAILALEAPPDCWPRLEDAGTGECELRSCRAQPKGRGTETVWGVTGRRRTPRIHAVTQAASMNRSWKQGL